MSGQGNKGDAQISEAQASLTSSSRIQHQSPAVHSTDLVITERNSPLTTGDLAGRIPSSLRSPYPQLSSPPTAQRPLHIVLASTGSVASIKVPLIVQELMRYDNVRVQVIATESSLHFYDKGRIEDVNPESSLRKYDVRALAGENLAAAGQTGSIGASCQAQPQSNHVGETSLPRAHLWTDADEWSEWTKVGDPILHIELRRWADIVLVAPCSANTLAKLNAGICDSLLTSFMRALSPATPTLLFPAMNTLMYMHPLTARHLQFVQEVLGYQVIGPIQKRLACGDLGAGAMYEWSDIVDLVVQRFALSRKEEAKT